MRATILRSVFRCQIFNRFCLEAREAWHLVLLLAILSFPAKMAHGQEWVRMHSQFVALEASTDRWVLMTGGSAPGAVLLARSSSGDRSAKLLRQDGTSLDLELRSKALEAFAWDSLPFWSGPLPPAVPLVDFDQLKNDATLVSFRRLQLLTTRITPDTRRVILLDEGEILVHAGLANCVNDRVKWPSCTVLNATTAREFEIAYVYPPLLDGTSRLLELLNEVPLGTSNLLSFAYDSDLKAIAYSLVAALYLHIEHRQLGAGGEVQTEAAKWREFPFVPEAVTRKRYQDSVTLAAPSSVEQCLLATSKDLEALRAFTAMPRADLSDWVRHPRFYALDR